MAQSVQIYLLAYRPPADGIKYTMLTVAGAAPRRYCHALFTTDGDFPDFAAGRTKRFANIGAGW